MTLVLYIVSCCNNVTCLALTPDWDTIITIIFDKIYKNLKMIFNADAYVKLSVPESSDMSVERVWSLGYPDLARIIGRQTYISWMKRSESGPDAHHRIHDIHHIDDVTDIDHTDFVVIPSYVASESDWNTNCVSPHGPRFRICRA